MTSLRGSLARRVSTVRSHVRSPGEGWLVARMLVWRLLLPALKRLLPLSALVRLMGSGRRSHPPQEAKVIELAVWLYGPRALSEGDNCLERSLLLYRYLPRVDARTRLMVGFRSNERGVEGHAWVALDERRLGAVPDEDGEFEPLLEFGPDGRAADSREVADVH
jgi:hypothetical protein